MYLLTLPLFCFKRKHWLLVFKTTAISSMTKISFRVLLFKCFESNFHSRILKDCAKACFAKEAETQVASETILKPYRKVEKL